MAAAARVTGAGNPSPNPNPNPNPDAGVVGWRGAPPRLAAAVPGLGLAVLGRESWSPAPAPRLGLGLGLGSGLGPLVRSGWAEKLTRFPGLLLRSASDLGLNSRRLGSTASSSALPSGSGSG